MRPTSVEKQMRAVESLQLKVSQFLDASGADQAVIELQCLGSRAAARTRVRHGSQVEENVVPGDLVREAAGLRVVMAHPKGGAWTGAQFSMDAGERRLATDFDYDRKPELDPPVTAADCAKELKLFPRDPRATPEWMAGHDR